MRNNVRTIIPTKVAPFLILSKKAIEKHLADGINSPLNIVDMAEVETHYNLSLAVHILAEKSKSNRQIAVQNRNQLLGIDTNQNSKTQNTLNYYVRSIRDTLLGTYRGMEQTLCEWGFEVNASKGNPKVVMSKKPDFLIDIAEKILKKHLADGSSSVLNIFDMLAFDMLLNQAKTQHDLADKLSKTTEKAYQDRHLALGFGNGKRSSLKGTLLHDILSIKNILLGNFKGNEKHLHDWGFEVNDTPRVKKGKGA